MDGKQCGETFDQSFSESERTNGLNKTSQKVKKPLVWVWKLETLNWGDNW